MMAARKPFQGYRVQHHLTLGPTKGGTRFAPSLVDGRDGRAGHVDELEMCAGQFALRRRQGRCGGRSIKLSRTELEAVSRRYMQEMIPFVGPHTDIMGPDMGTNEQIMAWFMDTYSVYHGYAVNEIVTGKPVAIGGTEGRREATGRGVVYLNRARHEHAENGSGEMHCDRAGISVTSAQLQRFRSRYKSGAQSDRHQRCVRSRSTIPKESTSKRPNNTC